MGLKGFENIWSVMFRSVSFLWLCAAFLFAAPPSGPEAWDLIFEDEFEGTALDSKKWNSTYNWGNTHNHRAYCAPENILVENGFLRIKGEAKRHPKAPPTASNGGKTYSLDYTSGAIDTKNKFSTQYGYIEGRFKAPKQLGTWPAFWTLQDGWPPEIDILEIPHERNKHHYYMHYTEPSWYASHGDAWDHEASFGGTHTGPNKAEAFYNYGVEWDSESMKFYFDDKQIASYNRVSEISQAKEMYIIINLAIGGWAGDNIEVKENNPAYFEADWVRVWKLKSIFPDTVRIRSLDENKCILFEDKKLYLGDCQDEKALLRLKQLSSNTYALYFGSKVFEIPNESKDAGAAVGLWDWNGKDHQKVVFEKQKDFESYVVRMKMKHSGHYIRSKEGSIIQDWNDSWPWNQNWEIILDKESEVPIALKQTKAALIESFQFFNNHLHLHFSLNGVEMKIVDLQGRLFYHQKPLAQKSISLETFPQGVYQVILQKNQYRQEFRLFKRN